MRRKVFAIAFDELIKSSLYGHHGYGKSLWKHTISSPLKNTLLRVCTSVQGFWNHKLRLARKSHSQHIGKYPYSSARSDCLWRSRAILALRTYLGVFPCHGGLQPPFTTWKIRTSVSHGSTKKVRKTKEIPRIEGTIFKMWWERRYGRSPWMLGKLTWAVRAHGC